MIGVKFRNVHSSTFKVGAKTVDRSLAPEMRKNEFVVPGRHGTIDYGLNTYEKRKIPVKITTFDNATFEDLRESARDLAYWLSGKGPLIFDDEPDKLYNASVYEAISIQQIYECLPVGELDVVFECQPFAESLEYRGVNIPHVTTKLREIPITVNGTAETGCIITIKNVGSTAVTGISVRRKVEV